jgi:hypothetical protein
VNYVATQQRNIARAYMRADLPILCLEPLVDLLGGGLDGRLHVFFTAFLDCDEDVFRLHGMAHHVVPSIVPVRAAEEASYPRPDEGPPEADWIAKRSRLGDPRPCCRTE